jgi:hypothetical protein
MKRKALFMSAIVFAFFAGLTFANLTGCSEKTVEAGSCFDIKELKVIFANPINDMEGVCRLEFEIPHGFIPVDKKGEKLAYHPWVLVKKN